MKKLALLLVLTIVLAFSFTYATDTAVAPDSTAPVVSGETSEDNAVTDVTGEADNTEDTANTDVSGDDAQDTSTPVSGEETTNPNAGAELPTAKSTVWGAVFAIIIVVMIVLAVAFMSKND